MHYHLVFSCVALFKGVELRDDGGVCWVRYCRFGFPFQCPNKHGAMIAGGWIAALLGVKIRLAKYSA
jgi:hypothetical protein